jgi:uncharacterized protein
LAGPSDVISAVLAGDREKLKRLLDEDRLLASARDERGISALMHAYYHRHVELAELLIRAKKELDIFEATAAGRSERVAEILDGDQQRARSWSGDGFTALHFAAFFDRPEIARNLIRHGADIGAVSRNDMRVTPLHSAAAARSQEIVRLLVEGGAPANAQQQGGWTALHAAAQAGDKEMVRTLLEYRADPRLLTDDGRTPVQMAKEKGHEEIVSLLGAA